ncbi:MAG: LysR family transcriptional regulator [Candidatus Binatia bacterium]
MTLHQLRIFKTVAKHLNVTRASEELHITQPAVSRQLRLLAEECGVTLYKTIARGIELTQEGRLFLSSAGPILTEVERIKKIFCGNGKAEELRIGGSQSLSLSFIPVLCGIYRRTHPEVRIVIKTGNGHDTEQLVLKSEIEIGVITNPSHHFSLIYEVCRKEKLVAVSSVRHEAVKKPRLTASELARAPLIVHGKAPGEDCQSEAVLKQLEERGLTPNVVMRCDSSLTVKAAVKAGVGIAILHQEMVEPEVKRRDLKIVRITDLKMETESFIIYSKDSPLSLNAQDFLALLRQWQGARCEMRKLRLA